MPRHDPTPLRDVLVPLRNAELGQQQVAEATLCAIVHRRTDKLIREDGFASRGRVEGSAR